MLNLNQRVSVNVSNDRLNDFISDLNGMVDDASVECLTADYIENAIRNKAVGVIFNVFEKDNLYEIKFNGVVRSYLLFEESELKIEL